MSRSERFGESQDEYRLLSAFSGSEINVRMNDIRKFIVEVREDYHEPHSILMKKIDKLFKKKSKKVKGKKYEEYIVDLLSSRRGFSGLCDTIDEKYCALWLYTSQEGYDGPFKWAKEVFRTKESSPEDLRLATFLVELINIDLFNYWNSQKLNASFEGWVYRGLWMTNGDFEELKNKANHQNIEKRRRSIPLALDSCSKSKDEALGFLDYSSGDIPVLQKIKVHGLNDLSLGFYQRKYPLSVVSTICATDISAKSEYQRENEVLMRGGFYQLLNVKEDVNIFDGKQLQVIEMHTMNSNRDHPSTPQDEEGIAPRELFNALVIAERNKDCSKYYREENMEDIALLYESELNSQADEFRNKYQQDPPWL